MQIPDSALPLWAQYVSSIGEDPSDRYYEAFYFADTEETANRLAELVLAGTKRATAGLLWSYEHDGDPLPRAGNLSVVTLFDGTPKGVIETTGVEVIPFCEVTEEFAHTEGEGDKSLGYWRRAHWAFFARECEQMDRVPDESMPVVCERFTLVFPTGPREG